MAGDISPVAMFPTTAVHQCIGVCYDVTKKWKCAKWNLVIDLTQFETTICSKHYTKCQSMDAKQNTKYTKQKPSTPNKIASVPTKSPSEPNKRPSMWICMSNVDLRCFFAKQNFCTFSTIFVVFFKSLKIWWCIKNDKYQVCRHYHHPPL